MRWHYIERMQLKPKHNEHAYDVALEWQDPAGEGTLAYATYPRSYKVAIAGKPDLLGSADAMFRGDASRHNPEDFYVAAIAACHMLSYLAIAARGGVRVLAYADDARGRMIFEGAGGHFVDVLLRPRVVVAQGSDVARAREMHAQAHGECYLAASCNFPIRNEPTIEVR
jgi:organic hydroperoxide reductase OsmC/OhrA